MKSTAKNIEITYYPLALQLDENRKDIVKKIQESKFELLKKIRKLVKNELYLNQSKG